MSQLEDAAEKFVDTDYFRLEYSTFGTTAKECIKAFKAGAEWTKDPNECAPETKLTERDQDFCMSILEFFVKHNATTRSVPILENALWLARLAAKNVKAPEAPPTSKLILL